MTISLKKKLTKEKQTNEAIITIFYSTKDFYNQISYILAKFETIKSLTCNKRKSFKLNGQKICLRSERKSKSKDGQVFKAEWCGKVLQKFLHFEASDIPIFLDISQFDFVYNDAAIHSASTLV